MPTDLLDLAGFGLTSGGGRRIGFDVELSAFTLADQEYLPAPEVVPVILDISRTTGSGWALRLRLEVTLTGVCMRCLDPATLDLTVDAREVDQPGLGDDELSSPYMDEAGTLDLAGWVRGAVGLALPGQVACRSDCAGLCPRCGVNLNEEPDHTHESEPDPRWAKLAEIRFE